MTKKTHFFDFILISFEIFISPCFSQNITIIVSNWPLWSECQSSSPPTSFLSPEFSTKYQGFLIDIFTNSFPNTISSNLTFYCYEWNDTLQLISAFSINPPKDHHIFLGPLQSKTNTIKNNTLLFSYPIYSSHLFMVQQPKFSLEVYFYYLRGFDVSLWFFIIFLLFIVANLLWFFEQSDDNKMPLKYFEGIKEAIWQTLLYVFFMGNSKIRSLPGRILICTMFVTSYMLTVYFMCAVVSRMMNNYENVQFSRLNDLTDNDNIHSFDEYSEYIHSFNPSVKVNGNSWDSNTDKIFEKVVKSGNGHVLIPDFLADLLIKDSCQLQKSSEYFSVNFYLTFLLTDTFKNSEENLVYLLNQGIIKLRNSYKYNVFYNLRFLQSKNFDGCQNSNVDFSEMYGIWIIFFFGLIISFLSFGIRFLLNKWIWKKSDSYEKIFGKNSLRRGFKRLIYEEKKLIQQALIEYFDRILMIYESKHKEILKNLKNIVNEKRDSIEKVEKKLKDLHSELEN